MNNDIHETKVVFRKWNNTGTVIALFPSEKQALVWGVMSYEHIGQHGGADYCHVIKQTTLATPKEFEALKKELESIGYKLNVRMKR